MADNEVFKIEFVKQGAPLSGKRHKRRGQDQDEISVVADTLFFDNERVQEDDDTTLILRKNNNEMS